MINVLLFDFYGVFIEDAYSKWLEQNNQRREGVFAALIEQRDKGSLSDAGFIAGLSSAIGRNVTFDEIHSARSHLNEQLVVLLRNLKKNYRICLFSNASSKLQEKLVTLGIDDLFDTVVVSGEIGYIKPSHEAFRVAFEKINALPREVLFIDDNPANIHSARQYGVNALQYTSFSDLQQKLIELNIIKD